MHSTLFHPILCWSLVFSLLQERYKHSIAAFCEILFTFHLLSVVIKRNKNNLLSVLPSPELVIFGIFTLGCIRHMCIKRSKVFIIKYLSMLFSNWTYNWNEWCTATLITLYIILATNWYLIYFTECDRQSAVTLLFTLCDSPIL